MTRAKCADCEMEFDAPEGSDWAAIPDLFMRIEPGGEVPVCECPECGALAYLVKGE